MATLQKDSSNMNGNGTGMQSEGVCIKKYIFTAILDHSKIHNKKISIELVIQWKINNLDIFILKKL
jgi:hypothetical protein